MRIDHHFYGETYHTTCEDIVEVEGEGSSLPESLADYFANLSFLLEELLEDESPVNELRLSRILISVL